MDSYKVVISSYAQQDIASCISFVLNVSKEAAINLRNDIFSSLESLSTFPERNPIFNMPSTFLFTIRQMIINKRYIALYSIEGHVVYICRVIDSRRQFDYLIN